MLKDVQAAVKFCQKRIRLGTVSPTSSYCFSYLHIFKTFPPTFTLHFMDHTGREVLNLSRIEGMAFLSEHFRAVKLKVVGSLSRYNIVIRVVKLENLSAWPQAGLEPACFPGADSSCKTVTTSL